MLRLFKIAAAAAAALAMAGCVAIAPAPAGPLKAGGAAVTLGRDWANMNAVTPQRPTKVTVLSIDGLLLNRLYISDGLSPGEGLIKPLTKDQIVPTVKAGFSNTERMELIAASISALDYVKVETAKPRAATYAGHPALRFDISAATKAGLDVLGTALVAEVDGKTYVILYLAPAEHYYAAQLAEVEQVMASARLGG